MKGRTVLFIVPLLGAGSAAAAECPGNLSVQAYVNCVVAQAAEGGCEDAAAEPAATAQDEASQQPAPPGGQEQRA